LRQLDRLLLQRYSKLFPGAGVALGGNANPVTQEAAALATRSANYRRLPVRRMTHCLATFEADPSFVVDRSHCRKPTPPATASLYSSLNCSGKCWSAWIVESVSSRPSTSLTCTSIFGP